MSYTKDEQGQVTVFTTQPEAVPVPWGLLVLPAVPIVGFLFVNVVVSLVFATIIGALVWARMKVFPAATKHRQPSTFKVSAEGVSIDGKEIKRRDIHRAIIRNHVLDGGNPSNFVTLHQGVGAMVGGVGAAANAKAKGQLADISYRVDVEAGGVAHTLAGGLNESTAFAVLSDVSGVLGLT
jgi:hypothetical protein